jgi:predicted HTH transcriptional regulator
MRSIFIGSPPLKTVFSFLFSYNLIIRRKSENINGFSVFIFCFVFDAKKYPFNMASPVIADPFHRMKYMERHGSGLRKIVRETEKPPGYTAAYNPKIFSTATDFRVILKNVNYQLSQKNLVNDQVSEQDKSPDIPHTVLNLCIHLIAHGSEGAQITHAHSIMGTANDKSYDATHDNLEDDTHQGIHQDSHHDSTPSAVILHLMLFRFFSQS